MMENTVHPEQELEKHNELESEMPSTQSPENPEPAQKEEETEPIKKLQDELAEAKDKFVRLFAEFENHRRRSAKEKLELIQSANEQLIKSMLPVVDDFERAEKSFKERNDKEAEGFFLIQAKFRKLLEQFGLKEMGVDKASAFDPDFHEAVTQIPASDENLKGKIVDVVEKGYLLNDKVIRFAKVVVGG